MNTEYDANVVPLAAVWRRASTSIGNLPVEVHLAGSDEQVTAVLGRLLDLFTSHTSSTSEPLFRVACAADAYLNEVNTTLVRHGTSKSDRKMPRVAIALGTCIDRDGIGANFSVEAASLPHDAVVIVVQHGHTVCMTSVRGQNGEAIALTGPRAVTCVIAAQRLSAFPGDLEDLGTYFGVSGMVISPARAPVPA